MHDPEKYAVATVVDRNDFAPDLWTTRIRPQIDLTFRPGQYVTVGLQIGDRIIERPYSIASAPEEDAIELFIERVPEGELTAPLFDLPPGSDVLIRKRCKGLFLKEVPLDNQPHLFVATVTGVAPFVSAIRSLKAKYEAEPAPKEFSITVIQGASRSEELGYATELTRLAAEVPWLTYVATVSRPWDDSGWEGETGRVEDIIRKYADVAGLRPGHGGVFLCGHPQMIKNARGIMVRRGLDDKAVREEQYWPE